MVEPAWADTHTASQAPQPLHFVGSTTGQPRVQSVGRVGVLVIDSRVFLAAHLDAHVVAESAEALR